MTTPLSTGAPPHLPRGCPGGRGSGHGHGGARRGERAGGVGATRALGAFGEEVAARYLTDVGMVVVDRNCRLGRGELDIVLMDGDCAVVCEVKTRRTAKFGEPVEFVSWVKQRQLRQLAAQWISTRPAHQREVRIDVVGVLVPDDGPVRIRHVRGVGG